MKVGRLRHRGLLQRRIDVEIEGGELIQGYLNVAEIWISIEPMSGREYFTAQQIAADVTTSIKMRWRPGIDPTYRILHQVSGDSPPAFEIYDITAALEDPIILRRWITLLCTKRFAEGFRAGDQPGAPIIGALLTESGGPITTELGAPLILESS